MNRRRKQAMAWIALVLTFSLCAAAEPPQTYYVDGACGNNTWTGTSPICQAPDGPKRTIRAGVAAATSAHDTVVVADGTYTGTGNTNITFPAHGITVRSANGRANCIIDCEGMSRAFAFPGGISIFSSLSGFTMKNGMATSGGAIFISGAAPRITECSFIGCEADLGGAIYNENNTLFIAEITNCTFQGNRASSLGGAVYNSVGDSSLTNCTFFSNSAIAGGAMYNESSAPDISGCRFIDNSATSFGGAMTNSNSQPTVTDCTFTGNSSGQGGGAIASSGGSAPDVKKCKFFGNTSQDGGAMFNFGNQGTAVTNCEFSNNTATRFGGGIYNNASGPAVNDCTFTGNAANQGGAICNLSSSSTAVNNSILWSNLPDEINDQSGSVTIVRFSDVQGGFSGVGNIDVPPGFVDPTGGDFHIMGGSPVNDAGANLLVLPGVTFDLDGNPRFVDDPGAPNTGLPGGGFTEIVDMGAYEFQGESCYADCDGSGTLDIFDFLCFQNSFVLSEPYACDCDPDPACDIFDFLCFQNAFVAGCP